MDKISIKPVLADNAGFCYGVERAFGMAMEASSKPGDKYTLGPLIHNKSVVDKLESAGVEVLAGEKDLDSLTQGIVIIRSHGVPKQVVEAAAVKGLEVVDATCPFVRRVHEAAEMLKAEGYELVLVGDRGHPEIEGIMGTIENAGYVIQSASDISGLPDGKRYGVIAQTTQSMANVQQVVAELLEKAREVRVINTICTATKARQQGVAKIARDVDIIIVIGDSASANTKRLAELSEQAGVRTYLVQNAGELDEDWFWEGAKVGVTAGASTPSWIIEEVMRRMQETGDEKKENTTSANEQPNIEETDSGIQSKDTEKIESMADVGDFSQAFRELQTGDVIEAYVVGVTHDEVMVDVGYKSEGVIPLNELSHRPLQSAKDVVSVGDTVTAKVIRMDDNEGNVVLSVRQAQQAKAWLDLKASFEAGKRIKGKVMAVVKGGVTVDVGVRGFLPASQIDRGFVNDLTPFVGQEFEFYITEMDEKRHNVVLSRRKVLDEDYGKAKAEVYETVKEGDVKDGVVKRLASFGAFIDIGNGVEGLLHISEMSWGRIKHLSEVMKEGQPIKVMVLGVDKAKERISLGLKQIMEHPWAKVPEKYPVGSIVEGTVANLANFGAFVKLEDGIEGLVHISQLSDKRVVNPAEVVHTGQKVKVKVVNIDENAKRIGLSIKEALDTPAQSEDTGEDQEPTSYSTDSGEGTGVTLGDIFSKALKKE